MSKTRIRLISAFLASYLAATPSLPSEKRRFEARDLVAAHALSDLQISPDGKWLAFVVSSPDESRNRMTAEIWIAATDGSNIRRLTNSPGSDNYPRWSPDGSSIAFLSDRREVTQVFSLPLAGGEARQITRLKTRVHGFEWAPDGKQIALLAAVPPDQDAEQNKKKQGDAYIFGTGRPRSQVWIQAVADGEGPPATVLTDGRLHIEDLSWESTGRRIAVIIAPDSEADAAYEAACAIVDVSSRRLSIVPACSGARAIDYSPGSEILALVRPFDGKGISRHDLLLLRDGAGDRNVSASIDRDIDKFRWSRDGKSIYFSARTGAHSVIYQARGPDWKMEILRESQGVIKDVQADSRGRLYVIGSGHNSADEIWSFSPPAAPERLTRFNRWLDDISLGKTEVIRWKSKDGLEIEGLLVVPADSQKGLRYPLIVEPHGGPRGQRDASFDAQSQFFAARGYPVLKPNFRGSTGYGDQFTKGNVGDWGDLPFADVMAGADKLIADGVADPENLFLYGWSYGGYMANWAITHTNRFKAVASGAGVADGIMQYVISDARRWRFDYFRGSPFTGNLDIYRQQSPVSYIREAKTPALFIHGERDERCPIQQGIMMHRALKDQGVETEMVVYPREGHGFTELRHIVDRAERVLAWFEAHRKRPDR